MDKIENDGQIKFDSPMGKIIADYANDTRFSRFLEIGTWNGGGSTYCFAKGFENRKETFQFVSLEINEENMIAVLLTLFLLLSTKIPYPIIVLLFIIAGFII